MLPYPDIFDAAGLIGLACLMLIGLCSLPARFGRQARWLLPGLAVVIVAAVRVSAGSAAALDVLAAMLLAAAALVVGYPLLRERRMPTRPLVIALAMITATGAYLRAYRFDDLRSTDLQPDVRYYQQQALRTANPFAAGEKSPLWPAMHAPLVRTIADQRTAMRVWSWLFGVAMLPLVGWTLARLFDPVVGVIVAGSAAVDSFLIDLCCQGLREEMGVCLWMGLLAVLFGGAGGGGWRRSLLAGATGGVLLLLRNIAVVPLMAMLAWGVTSGRMRWTQAAVAAGLSLVAVVPFYVNQWQAYGDPLAMEKRDARYHANLEFGRNPPPGLTMPSPQELERNLYAGEPLSPADYLLKHRSFGEFLALQWRGLTNVWLGRSFQFQASPWMRLICAGALLALALVPGKRFTPVFVLAGLVGIKAHLSALGQLNQRLLLEVMILWLAAGWWAMAELVRIGGCEWLKYKTADRS